VDGDEFTGPVKASELDGVLAVVLPTLARSHRDERRSHHVTLVAPIGELTVKDVARTAGLVAGAGSVAESRNTATITESLWTSIPIQMIDEDMGWPSCRLRLSASQVALARTPHRVR
jgi:hypothetical protein